jgi:hypothetical protein
MPSNGIDKEHAYAPSVGRPWTCRDLRGSVKSGREYSRSRIDEQQDDYQPGAVLLLVRLNRLVRAKVHLAVLGAASTGSRDNESTLPPASASPVSGAALPSAISQSWIRRCTGPCMRH